MWTQFMDMHSGGGRKLEWEYIYIEAPQEEAKAIFYNRYGRNPDKITCTCCGPDYSLTESETLEDATAYERGCDYVYFRPDGSECGRDEGWDVGKGIKEGYRAGYVERHGDSSWKKYIPLAEYLKGDRIKVVYADDIRDNEKAADIPAQGYVWVG